jgi:hypothetical protein
VLCLLLLTFMAFDCIVCHSTREAHLVNPLYMLRYYGLTCACISSHTYCVCVAFDVCVQYLYNQQVTQFFSYEHFYVLFCRFYELDIDRDNRLSRENLLKYGDHALSSAIVDRIFEVCAVNIHCYTIR